MYLNGLSQDRRKCVIRNYKEGNRCRKNLAASLLTVFLLPDKIALVIGKRSTVFDELLCRRLFTALFYFMIFSSLVYICLQVFTSGALKILNDFS